MTDKCACTGPGQATAAQIHTSRSCSGSLQNCATRDFCPWTASGCTSYVTLPMAVSSTSHHRVCLRAGGTSGSCPSLLALRGIGSGVALDGPGDTLRIYCANGLRTPHSLHILRSWFHFSYGVCAGLPPLSPDALCSVAVSLSPWGATRLGGAIAPIPLPTCGVLSCRI